MSTGSLSNKEEVTEKSVKVRGLKDHECTIGKNEHGHPAKYTITKGKSVELPKSVAAVLSSAGIVMIA
jgi:hypothetical protein